MTEAEKMAERLEERGKQTPRTWATSDLYYESAALIRRMQVENERRRARETRLVEALVSIEEYWNRSPTEGAMLDALDVMTARARATIEGI
jgi:hypothetical protein